MLQEEPTRSSSPNNTFRTGPAPADLQPGPAAILAALEPPPAIISIFYAKGDGSHDFAKTLRASAERALFGKK
jgi:cell division protein YceG involved in septum cleavage